MSKVLAAYFSAGGTTEGIAEKLAQAASAYLYEIKAERKLHLMTGDMVQ